MATCKRIDHLLRKKANPALYLMKAREATARYRAKNPIYRQRSYTILRFGLEPEVVQSFVDSHINKNGPVCEICGDIAAVVGGVKVASKKRLVVDHNHKTGKLRGMLCDFCNTAIGKLKEDPQILQNAIYYITTRK